MLRQSFGKVMLVSHEQRSYAWKLTDSGVKSSYLIGWHAHFHGYGHLRWICGEAWRICRFRGSVWAFWLNHCHWLIFSTDSAYIFDALVFISECLLFRSSNVCYYEWFLPTISGNIFDNVQFAIAANDLESLYNVCIRSLKRISMPHGRILLTSYWAAPSTTQAEASL
jgi:hypothetical protein